MKKLLLSVIAFAMITTSCNKYKDDFKNLNARLDALSTQVAGIPALISGIQASVLTLAQLNTALAGLPTNASVTTAITAGLATGLASITATINGIKGKLDTLALNVASGNITTQGLITQLGIQTAANIADLQIALTAAIAANNAPLAALIQAQITLANVPLQTSITDSQQALTFLINALQTALNTANANINNLLSTNDIFNGNLTINSEATLAQAESFGSKVKIILGDLTINTTTFTTTQMSRLKQVTNGTQTAPATAWIGSVSGNVSVTSSRFSSTAVDLGKLSNVGTTVGNTASFSGFAPILTSFSSVAGSLTLDYDGPYASTSLTSVGGTLTLVDKPTAAAVTNVNPTEVGTTSINIPNLTGSPIIATTSHPLATSVNLGRISTGTFTYAIATSVRFGNTSLSGAGGLTIVAPSATSVNLSSLASSSGPLDITTDAGGTVDLSVYADATTARAVTITGPTTISLPAYTNGTLTSSTAETVTMPVHRWTNAAVLGAVKSLTLGAVRFLVTLDTYTTLVTASVNGSATVPGSVSYTAGATALTTLSVGGTLSSVTVIGLGTSSDKLTSFTTSGQISVLTVDNNDKLAGMTLGHSHITGGAGSSLTVTNNDKLTSLTTSTNFGILVHIENNILLTTLNLGSYTSFPAAGVMTWTIKGNKLSGTYKNAVAPGALPFVEADINSTLYASIKAMLIAAYTDRYDLTTGSIKSGKQAIVLDLGLESVVYTTGTAAATTLSAKLTADAAAIAQYAGNVNGTWGGNITNYNELNQVR